jgi:hypothetical protein
LLPEEHYKAHKILAESFTGHKAYGKKMLWAFHRMTYSKGRYLTEQEYIEARLLLMPLWKREKSEDWKKIISQKMKGNKNGVDGKRDWVPTEEQRKNYSKAATTRQLGKIGEESRASKGAVVCENKLTGAKIEAGSTLQLAKKVNIHYSVLHEVLNSHNYEKPRKPRTKVSKYYQFLQDHEIYYKN